MDKNRLMLALLLAVSVLFMQVAGSHFHVHQSAIPGDQAGDVHTHGICIEDSCGVDLSVAAFIKKFDPGWDAFAVILAVLLVWPLWRRRAYRRPPTVARPPASPDYLRPLLRAPPLHLVPGSR